MTRDTQDIVLQEIFKISGVLGGINTKIINHDEVLDRIEGQTTRTNGRVTKLEDVTVTLTVMLSKQNGIYEQNLLGLKDLIITRGLEIDELKKKVSGDESQLKNTTVQGGIEIRKIVWGGVITTAVTLTTLILTKIL